MKRLELDGVTKFFEPSFTALDKVTMRFAKGEVHMVLGENGAGKSTLMHILSGMAAPSEGTIRADGVPVSFASTADALDAGVAMVHQRPFLCDDISCLENVMLGEKFFFLARRDRSREIAKIARRWGIEFAGGKPAATLSPRERLFTALLAALNRNPSFLILDEPTAILDPEERELFLETTARETRNGLGTVIITHKLGEAVRWADRISVLRRGKLVFSSPVLSPSGKKIVTEETLSPYFQPAITPGVPQAVRTKEGLTLTVAGLSAHLGNRQPLSDIAFTARPGEITGIFGLPGSGIDVLEDVLSGMAASDAGTIAFTDAKGLRRAELSGKSVTPRSLRAAGSGFVPSDRTFRGAHPELSIRDILAPFIGDAKESAEAFAKKTLAGEGINAETDRPARTLSGGQLQRLILARELSAGPEVLILAEPEWGLDISSVNRFRERLAEAARRNMTVLILTDSPDAMTGGELYSRVYHLDEGRLR